MQTAQTSQKLVAGIAASAITFTIVVGIAQLGYPAARAAPIVVASSHVSR